MWQKSLFSQHLQKKRKDGQVESNTFVIPFVRLKQTISVVLIELYIISRK